MVKKWEIVESKNRFYCDGRCLTGRDVGIFIFALFLITVTSGLFFGFDCPYLAHRLSPAVPVVGALIFVSVICFILRTACSDPGILPRASSDEVSYLERSTHITSSPQSVALPGRTIEVQLHTGHVIHLKFCSTCKVFRPPRVSHCSLCDACIANFDHHCPWVGNCVGLRNYRYFYLFLFALSILCVYIFTFNIVNVVLRAQDKPSFAEAIRDTPATVVEALICFFSMWSVIGLWGYHTYLICRSVTTNEDIKHTWSSSRRGVTRKNPFSRGNPCLNCFAALCGPLPPSFLNLRAVVVPDDSSHSRSSRMMNSTSFDGNGYASNYQVYSTVGASQSDRAQQQQQQQHLQRYPPCDYV